MKYMHLWSDQLKYDQSKVLDFNFKGVQFCEDRVAINKMLSAL